MINTIFYFADTELEYLDNYSRHQVKPYTIVFCKDTKSLWKNGIRYGSSTQTEMNAAIDDVIARDVTPLITALDASLDSANQLANTRYNELTGDYANLMESLAQTRAAAEEEKERLSNTINNLDTNISSKVEGMLNDSEWVQSNWPQGVTDYQAGWNDNVKAYLQTVGLWDYDDNGATTTKWSQIRQTVNGILSTVNQVTKPVDGTLATLQSAINQEITDRGEAVTNIENTYSKTSEETKKVLEWMYSGLNTGAGPDRAFADLVTAAKSGDHSGISNINMLVTPVKDANGNITGYKAKNEFSAAVDDSLSTLLQNASYGKSGAELLTSVGNDVASIKAEVDEFKGASASLTAAFNNKTSGVLTKTDAEKTYATLGSVNDLTGDMSEVKTFLGDNLAQTSLSAKMKDSIATFDISTDGLNYANGTLVAKLNKNSEDLAELTTEATTELAKAALAAKFKGMSGGMETIATNKMVEAGLVSKNQDGSVSASVYTKVEGIDDVNGIINSARSGMVASTPEGAASIIAEVNKAGSEVKISADKLKIDATTTEFNTAVGQLVQALALEQIDIEGNVQAILEDGNARFNGKVNASELQAGDDTDLHIVTTENQLLFKNGDKVVGRFVVDGDGLLLFVLNSKGLEYKIDWDNWSRTSTVAFDQEVFYGLNQEYSNNEYVASWTPYTYYKYNGQYYRDSNNDESYLENISLSDNLNKRYKMTTRYLLYPVPLRYENENTGHSVIVPVRVLEFRQVYFDDGDIGYTNNYIYATNFIPEYVGVCCNGNESFTQGDITIYPINVEYYPQTKCRWVSKLNSSNYDYYLEVADPDLDEEYAAISNDRINVVNPISIGGQMTLYTSPISTQDLPDMSNNYLYSNNGHNR